MAQENNRPGRPMKPIDPGLPPTVVEWLRQWRAVVLEPLRAADPPWTLERMSAELTRRRGENRSEGGARADVSGTAKPTLQRFFAGERVPARDVVQHLLDIAVKTLDPPPAPEQISTLWGAYRRALHTTFPLLADLYNAVDQRDTAHTHAKDLQREKAQLTEDLELSQRQKQRLQALFEHAVTQLKHAEQTAVIRENEARRTEAETAELTRRVSELKEQQQQARQDQERLEQEISLLREQESTSGAHARRITELQTALNEVRKENEELDRMARTAAQTLHEAQQRENAHRSMSRQAQELRGQLSPPGSPSVTELERRHETAMHAVEHISAQLRAVSRDLAEARTELIRRDGDLARLVEEHAEEIASMRADHFLAEADNILSLVLPHLDPPLPLPPPTRDVFPLETTGSPAPDNLSALWASAHAAISSGEYQKAVRLYVNILKASAHLLRSKRLKVLIAGRSLAWWRKEAGDEDDTSSPSVKRSAFQEWLLYRHKPVAALALVAMAAGGYAEYSSYSQRQDFRREHCGTMNPALVTRSSGECTGVTDGSDGSRVFGSPLTPVLAAADAENSKAVRGGRYVTVAFLASLSSTGKTKDLTLDQFVGEAEGAYTALEQANTGSGALKIRMVLANMGSGEGEWKDTVAALKREKNLVAVTGMGLSQQESLDAARELSKADLPMVADLLGADGFDTTGGVDGKGRINGLVRVIYPTKVLLTAVSRALAGRKHTAALVSAPVTPTDTKDFYTESLYNGFTTIEGLKKHLDPTVNFPFDPRDNDRASTLAAISQNLCSTSPRIDTVYFAMREKYLPDFLTALNQRTCPGHHITVVTGSGTAGVHLDKNLLHNPKAPVTVLYASLPNSADLDSAANPDRRLYRDFLQAFTSNHHGQTFPVANATRGYWAVFAHDAVLTAATAIHYVTPTTGLPNRHAVYNHLYALGNYAISGASGRFGIDPATGNRTTIPITVYHLGTAP